MPEFGARVEASEVDSPAVESTGQVARLQRVDTAKEGTATCSHAGHRRSKRKHARALVLAWVNSRCSYQKDMLCESSVGDSPETAAHCAQRAKHLLRCELDDRVHYVGEVLSVDERGWRGRQSCAGGCKGGVA